MSAGPGLESIQKELELINSVPELERELEVKDLDICVMLRRIFGNLILNWPKLLRPFKTVFCLPYIDVYVFAM